MPAEKKAKDPVCGMWVDPTSPLKERFNQTDFFFCSDACLAKFQTSPSTYASTRPK